MGLLLTLDFFSPLPSTARSFCAGPCGAAGEGRSQADGLPCQEGVSILKSCVWGERGLLGGRDPSGEGSAKHLVCHVC